MKDSRTEEMRVVDRGNQLLKRSLVSCEKRLKYNLLNYIQPKLS